MGMGAGILAGLAAGAFWGFTFIVPKFVPEASAMSLAFPGMSPTIGLSCSSAIFTAQILAFRSRNSEF